MAGRGVPRNEGFFCTDAYPAAYPEGTRSTRIRQEAIDFLTVVVVLVVARQIFKYYGQAPGYQNLDYYAKTPCTPAQKKMSASSRRDTKMTSCLFPLLVSLFFPKP